MLTGENDDVYVQDASGKGNSGLIVYSDWINISLSVFENPTIVNESKICYS